MAALRKVKITREFLGEIGVNRWHFKMANRLFTLKGLMGLVLLLSLILSPKPAQAKWPPFDFRLSPVHENGTIKYNIKLSSQVESPLANLMIKIPLPKGTRFVAVDTQPTISSIFDGAEVSFATSLLDPPLIDTFFVVEAVDPEQTVFETHAWIAWQGEQPGNYLTPNISFDINRQPLNWDEPSNPRLLLKASAAVTEGIVTYSIYLTNVGGLRMWDLNVKVPIPAGTTFLAAETPPKFTSNFDGREVSFFISELERRGNPPRLSLGFLLPGLLPLLLLPMPGLPGKMWAGG
jgi:hypothetical protein